MSAWTLCILLQLLDGFLTYVGVSASPLGLDAEGNPIIRSAMESLGPGTALLIVKSLAIGAILYLKARSSDLVMLKRVLGVVNLLYLISASLWIYVLIIL